MGVRVVKTTLFIRVGKRKGGLNEGWVGGKWVLVNGWELFLFWFGVGNVEMAQRV